MPHGGPHDDFGDGTYDPGNIAPFDLDAALANAPDLPGASSSQDADPFIGPGGYAFPDEQLGINRPLPYTGDWKDSVRPDGSRNVVPYAPKGMPVLGNEAVAFQYRRSSPSNTLFDMSPAQVLQVQRQLIDAGFNVDPTGYADSRTQNALAEVMGQANVMGSNWRAALTEMVATNQAISDQARRGAGGVRQTPTFNFDPYLPPDYDTLVTNVEKLFRDHLGRDPESHELTILADKMAALHRGDYDSQYQAALQKFEAQDFLDRQALVTENQLAGDQAATENPDDVMGDPLVNPAETGPASVDVASSVYQFFRQRYGNELDRVEAMRQNVANRELTTQQLLALSQLGSGPVNEL